MPTPFTSFPISTRALNIDLLETVAENIELINEAVDTTTTMASQAESSASAAAADRIQTGLDAAATAADSVQTGLDATAAAESADLAQAAADAAVAAAEVAGLPVGGTTGQVLAKASDTDGDADWVDLAVNPFPIGGTTGQVLAKASGADSDVEWVEPLPAGGTTGQVLTKASGDDGDVDWVDPSAPSLPAGGSTGQVLAKASSTDGDAEWVDPATGLVWQVESTTYTAFAGSRIIADTTSSAWTLTLPATPSEGDVVSVAKVSANLLTVAGGGADIEDASTFDVDVPNIIVNFVFDGTDWRALLGNGSLSYVSGSGSGDMVASTYDPQEIESDAFDRENHTGEQAIATVTGLQSALDGKSSTGHGHVISDVTSLQDALDAKADTSHTHAISDITDLSTALDSKQATLVSETNIKTINGQSILGSGDLTVDSEETNILTLGADPTGVLDSQPAFAAADTLGGRWFVPKGKYRINSPIPLSTGTHFYGDRSGDSASPSGSVLLQFGQKLFEADNDLRFAKVSGFSCDLLAATKNAWTVAFSLRAHRDCEFSDLYFVRYTDATIMERLPFESTINSVDNFYTNWYIEACLHVCITIGQDGWYHRVIGDGTTTVINTGITWPEQFNSSVSVFMEPAQRNFYQLTLGTDYTVSYPSGQLRVTLTSPVPSTSRVHIFPSQPRANDAAPGKQRRPFSNNSWSKIKTNYNFGHAWQDLRWNDAEFFDTIRFHCAGSSVRGFSLNPSFERTCEAGDFNTYDNCVMSYVSGADPETMWGWYLGPGSLQIGGNNNAMDLRWVYSGVNRAIQNLDRSSVALAGTVNITAGSTTVTGSGTAFRDKLTLIGDSKDDVLIAGNIYRIASINSNTSLTLLTPALTTSTGVAINRWNSKNATSYLFDFNCLGTSGYNNYRGGIGRCEYGSSTRFAQTVVIPAGATSVTVQHRLWRAPDNSTDLIYATPLSNLMIGGTSRVCWVSNITATTVQLNLNASYTSALNVKLVVELGALN